MPKTHDHPRATLTVSLPRPVRAAVYAESDRRGSTPSAVVAALLHEHLPQFVASEMRRAFDETTGTA
jgi:hypothetical protein